MDVLMFFWFSNICKWRSTLQYSFVKDTLYIKHVKYFDNELHSIGSMNVCWNFVCFVVLWSYDKNFYWKHALHLFERSFLELINRILEKCSTAKKSKPYIESSWNRMLNYFCITMEWKTSGYLPNNIPLSYLIEIWW